MALFVIWTYVGQCRIFWTFEAWMLWPKPSRTSRTTRSSNIVYLLGWWWKYFSSSHSDQKMETHLWFDCFLFDRIFISDVWTKYFKRWNISGISRVKNSSIVKWPIIDNKFPLSSSSTTYSRQLSIELQRRWQMQYCWLENWNLRRRLTSISTYLSRRNLTVTTARRISRKPTRNFRCLELLLRLVVVAHIHESQQRECHMSISGNVYCVQLHQISIVQVIQSQNSLN